MHLYVCEYNMWFGLVDLLADGSGDEVGTVLPSVGDTSSSSYRYCSFMLFTLQPPAGQGLTTNQFRSYDVHNLRTSIFVLITCVLPKAAPQAALLPCLFRFDS